MTAETRDERAERLTRIGMEVAVRIRDEDPADVRRPWPSSDGPTYRSTYHSLCSLDGGRILGGN